MPGQLAKHFSRRRLFQHVGGAAGLFALSRVGADPIVQAGSRPRVAGAQSYTGRLRMFGFGTPSNPDPASQVYEITVYRETYDFSIDISKDLDQWSDEIAQRMSSSTRCHLALEVYQEPVTNPPKVKRVFESSRALFTQLDRDNQIEYLTFEYGHS